MKKKAFTLAEVLITLGIIGIVASMTIPTLIANYKKTQYVTALKKAYSTWNQAINLMSSDSGTPGDLASFFESTDTATMGDKIALYFKVAKNCRNTDSGCFAKSYSWNLNNSPIKTDKDSGSFSYRFITTDGMSVLIGLFDTGGCTGHNASLTRMCATVQIDVNGLNPPNIFGRDIFELFIDNDKGPAMMATGEKRYLYWYSYGCNPPTLQSGEYCGGRIIDENWQMNY